MAPPPPPQPCCPRSLPALMEELVEEILLRISPDEPAHLFRAALVCKPWLRILSDPGFLRRYRAFHRAPPLLGYLHNLEAKNRAGIPPFALTSTASPLSTTTLPEELKFTNWVLDCRHGRVLIHAFMPRLGRPLSHASTPQYGEYLVVWDPITDGQKNVSLPGYAHTSYAGAVLCAVDGCDHLSCQDGPFLIVFAGSGDDSGYDLDAWVAIYSSETGLWSASISIDGNCVLQAKPPLLIRDTLYFSVQYRTILKCDLGAQELSVIESPGDFSHDQAIPMELDGGGLGSAYIEGDCLYILSWHGDANNGTGGWAPHLDMELETLLPKIPFCSHDVVGLMEGTSTVFISVSGAGAGAGLYTLDLKSRKVKRVGKEGNYYVLLPYTSFYTPDLAKGRCHHLHEDAKIDPLP